MAPSLKISLSSAGQKHAPCRLEISTRRREDLSRAGLNLSWPAAGIEAATPFPRIFIMRAADANRDRSYVDIAVIDVPAVQAFGISAAGDGGHTHDSVDHAQGQAARFGVPEALPR
jgi:hypothetical protein